MATRRVRQHLLRVCAATLLVLTGLTVSAAALASELESDTHWVGTWSASAQSADLFFVPTPGQFNNQTLRQIVHSSIGGERVRVRLSNELGTVPLVIGAAHIAVQSNAASIVSASDRTLAFNGQASTTIPSGAAMLSDPVDLDVPPLSNLAVSIYLPDATTPTTLHLLGMQTTYTSAPGNFSGAIDFPTASTDQHWYFLTGVEVVAASRVAAIVTFGDSITDGFNSTVNANHRWPNFLAARLQATPQSGRLAVMDEGISGNRVLHDTVGPDALSRFDRDVVVPSGVKFVTVLLGINDIGFGGFIPTEVVSAADIIAGHRQFIERAHAKGLRIFGCTLTPFGGLGPPYETPAGEAKRQAVNLWIRTSRAYDGVIDFDKTVRDPSQPTRMLPAYDSGDHLHPNDVGYKAMADSIELRLFSSE